MAQQTADRIAKLEKNDENLAESVKRLSEEVAEIKNNLQLSSEILNKLVGLNQDENNRFRSFAKFVEDSLSSMDKETVDETITQIVEIICKCKRDPNGV
ncbi:hypothetical protein GWI33_012540 [Rhynchophorus ferrugineus]|uniref:Uncharacterized protein n=1 Tax=Rhynchophorus ferrugineus TaxID=354439 RepID=A0A834I5C5_RHYFE|nr:hypothetical protein GWI33_012540 [Rhynchophorus ferrugineus]